LTSNATQPSSPSVKRILPIKEKLFPTELSTFLLLIIKILLATKPLVVSTKAERLTLTFGAAILTSSLGTPGLAKLLVFDVVGGSRSWILGKRKLRKLTISIIYDENKDVLIDGDLKETFFLM